MKICSTLLTAVAVLSLAACQTTGAAQSPSQTLYSNIDVANISETGTATRRSGTDSVCVTFYQNTASYVAQPASVKPKGGSGLLKTLVLGSLAGVASGGVAALGISSSFAEAALIGTASQMTYNTGETVYDKIVGPDDVQDTETALTPMEEIEKAAAALGCPAPDKLALKGAKAGTKELMD